MLRFSVPFLTLSISAVACSMTMYIFVSPGTKDPMSWCLAAQTVLSQKRLGDVLLFVPCVAGSATSMQRSNAEMQCNLQLLTTDKHRQH